MTLPALAEENRAPDAPSFDVIEYVVDGNSLLPDGQIETVLTAFMGERKSLSDVEAARTALERSYHEAGYLTVMVSIPEQKVDDGIVALHVVEAGVDRLRVTGTEFTLPSSIKSRIPELAEGNVPNFTKVQQQLAALNRSADVRITPVLKAGKLPGTVEVQLDAEDQLPLHGSVDYSNRQTPNTTAQRLGASLRFDNLFQLRHSVSLTAQVSPENTKDARVLAATYVVPVSESGAALSTNVVVSRSELASLSNAPGLGLLGNTNSIGLRLSQPLPASSDYAQLASVGLEYKRIGQTLLVVDGGGTDSPINYAPLSANYTLNLFGESRSSTFDVSGSLGLRGLLGNTDAAFNAKRSGATANFFALRSGLQHTENFGRWSLMGKVDVQIASGPLVPSEQLVAGGADSVRGYMEGERAGDGGVRATVELRTPKFKPLAQADWQIAGQLFFDAAALNTREAVAPQLARHDLRGAGVGVRLSAPLGLTLEVDAARALIDGDTTKAKSNRVHARTLWSF